MESKKASISEVIQFKNARKLRVLNIDIFLLLMSINTLTINMVEVPRFLITKRKFATIITYLRGVKWWGCKTKSIGKGISLTR